MREQSNLVQRLACSRVDDSFSAAGQIVRVTDIEHEGSAMIITFSLEEEPRRITAWDIAAYASLGLVAAHVAMNAITYLVLGTTLS